MSQPKPVSADLFRSLLGRFPSGVTVVTAARDGEIAGMTVSSFTSVSLEPPLVFVSLTMGKLTTKLVEESGWFAANVLSADQADLSERFAYADDADRFSGLEIETGAHGLPLLPDTVAGLECRVVQAHTAGDHLIFVAEVVTGRFAEVDPVVYLRGTYRRLDS